MSAVIWTLLILGALPYSHTGHHLSKNWYRVIPFTPCNGMRSYNMHLKDFKMVEDKDVVIMMGAIEVDEDVLGKISLRINTTRCDMQKQNCEEHEQPLQFDNVCASMESFSMFGSSFKQDIEPPLTCPFRKGTYKFNNVTANIGIISRLPIGGAVWIARISFLNESEKVIFCGNTGIVVKNQRKRPSNRGK